MADIKDHVIIVKSKQSQLPGSASSCDDICDHALNHQAGGRDEISVAGLSGLLLDLQKAGYIGSSPMDLAGLADQYVLKYDAASDTWIPASNSSVFGGLQASYDIGQSISTTTSKGILLLAADEEPIRFDVTNNPLQFTIGGSNLLTVETSAYSDSPIIKAQNLMLRGETSLKLFTPGGVSFLSTNIASGVPITDGTATGLTTTKQAVVEAINELDASIDTNASNINTLEGAVGGVSRLINTSTAAVTLADKNNILTVSRPYNICNISIAADVFTEANPFEFTVVLLPNIVYCRLFKIDDVTVRYTLPAAYAKDSPVILNVCVWEGKITVVGFAGDPLPLANPSENYVTKVTTPDALGTKLQELTLVTGGVSASEGRLYMDHSSTDRQFFDAYPGQVLRASIDVGVYRFYLKTETDEWVESRYYPGDARNVHTPDVREIDGTSINILTTDFANLISLTGTHASTVYLNTTGELWNGFKFTVRVGPGLAAGCTLRLGEYTSLWLLPRDTNAQYGRLYDVIILGTEVCVSGPAASIV